eukprot:Gb_18800 [translate_table: standard]
MLILEISAEGYSEVAITEEGKQSALLLCAEDLNYEVVDWLLNFAWLNVNNNNANTQVERDESEIVPIKEFSEMVSGFVREFSNGNAGATKTEEREQTMLESALQMVRNVQSEVGLVMWFGHSTDWLSSETLPFGGDTESWDNDVLWNAIMLIITHKSVVGLTDNLLSGRNVFKFDAHQVAMSVIYYVNSFIEETLLSDIKVRKHIYDGAWKAIRKMFNSPVMSTSIVDSEDDEGNSPLDMAAAQNNLEIFRMLLLRSKRSKTYFHKTDIGNVLRQSAHKGYFDLVDKLLENGANPLDSDGDGKTTLHYAADGDDEIASLDFFSRHARNIELTKVVDKNGRTVLHAAASRGHRQLCFDLMCRSTSNVLYNCKDRDGQTALHYAVKQNKEDVVYTLLEHRTYIRLSGEQPVDLRDLSGTTPLHIAAAQGNLTLVETLLLYQEDPRIGDFLGETALHKAARIGYGEITKKLLESGFQPLQERDCDGKTALHYAVKVEKRDDAVAIAKLLVGKCKTEEEKFLLLWASAASIGTAEESLTGQELLNNDPVKAFFDQEISGTQCNLVRTAAKLGYIDMTQEFLTRVVNQINKRIEQASERPTLSDDLGERKLRPEMSREMFLSKYNSGERNAFGYLQTMATGSRRLPREWKRMLNYHRLAWNIFSKSEEAKSLAGWQVQLVTWIFVCWQWKDQINTLIQTWHKLDVICNWKYFAEDWHQFIKGPSLREIVDHCMEEQQVGKVKSSKGDTILKKVRGKEEEKEIMVVEEKDIKAMKGGNRQYEEAKIKVLSEQEEGTSKGYEKYKRKISKVAHEEELEDWKNMSETLRKYNVSMEGMQAFQRFRFYCNSRYLPWPTPNTKSAYKWEWGYDKGKRPHRIV